MMNMKNKPPHTCHSSYTDLPCLTQAEYERMLTEYWFHYEREPARGLGQWFCERYIPNAPNPGLYYKRDYDQAREYILTNYTSRHYWWACWTSPKRT
jgi:hypothetical protein